MTEGIRLDNVAIVLCRPRFPENIGAAARAMRNMGIGNLVVVDPRDLDLPRVLKMATHTAAAVVEQMEVAPSLEAALAPFHFAVGTTARLGKQRQVISSPALLAEQLVPVSQQNRIAIVFGPEDRGLTNEDIRLCHWLVNIPTADFASLNLAQAVMIVCYSLFCTCAPDSDEPVPRLANRQELDGMYTEVKELLLRINYIQPDNPDYWMNRIRHFFTRMRLRAREVSMIRGICRQVNWYAGKRYQDGRDGKEV